MFVTAYLLPVSRIATSVALFLFLNTALTV